MSYSLNETEALAKKAARGAGSDWGVAEEAAVATRWLCENGVDGASILSLALSKPVEAISPLEIGATIADHAADLLTGSFEAETVYAPLILLPFAAMAARQIKRPVCVTADGVEAGTDGVSLYLDADFPSRAERVIVRAGEMTAPLSCRQTRAFPKAEAWAALGRLAHLTYAPATEESRRGAGAETSDND